MSVLIAEREFAQRLGVLEGQDFQDEVCRFLRHNMNDFQHVVAKPHGDGGLDGLSDDYTTAYFCYGPEQEPSKVKARGLASEIVRKFREDIRHLFELESKGKGGKATLSHTPNTQLGTILPPGKRISTVRLIVSVDDDHRVLGPLKGAFDKCRAASQCRYVTQTACMTLWSPKELATMGTVDDATNMRIDQRVLLKRLELALASSPAATTAVQTSDFDAKFDWVQVNVNPKPGAVQRLRSHFMKSWLDALAIENDFANNAVQLHQTLMNARDAAAIDADLASGGQQAPLSLIEVMRKQLTERMSEYLGARIAPELLSRLVDGEIARLIGECPIDWRT